MDTGNHNETSDGLDEEMIQKALAKHKQVLASLESAKEEALRSYSDLVQLQSSLVRVSSSLSSPTSSSTSSTSRSAVPRVVQMMGAADVMINSYRESLRLSPAWPIQALTPPRTLSPTRHLKVLFRRQSMRILRPSLLAVKTLCSPIPAQRAIPQLYWHAAMPQSPFQLVLARVLLTSVRSLLLILTSYWSVTATKSSQNFCLS